MYDWNAGHSLGKSYLSVELQSVYSTGPAITIGFCPLLHDIKYFYLIQVIFKQLYGFKFSYLKLIVIWFQEIILFNYSPLFTHR